MYKGFIFLSLLMVFSVSVVQASELTKDQLLNIRKLAKQGNAEAQYQLGMAYWDKDPLSPYLPAPRVAYWLRKAAKQGHVKAQYNLGKKFNQRLYWTRRAADQGYAPAQNEMGDLSWYAYEDLWFSTKEKLDYKEPVYWYKKAAEQGHVEAQFELGNMFYEGRGVEKDLQEAADWYDQAARQGDDRAQYSVALMYFTGQGVSRSSIMGLAWIRVIESATHGAVKWWLLDLSTPNSESENFFNGQIRDTINSMSSRNRVKAERIAEEIQHNIENNKKLASESKASGNNLEGSCGGVFGAT